MPLICSLSANKRHRTLVWKRKRPPTETALRHTTRRMYGLESCLCGVLVPAEFIVDRVSVIRLHFGQSYRALAQPEKSKSEK
jgi:hypothetical protein